jgi:hypothetical protein
VANPATVPDRLIIHEKERTTLGDISATNDRVASLNNQLSYEELNIDYRKRRTKASRLALARQVMSYAAGGSATRRLSALRERFITDFAMANSRMDALATGLDRIYNFTARVPDGPSENLFDEQLTWLRQATEHLVAIGIQEQGYILSLSVKAIVNDVKWAEGLTSDGRSGKWQMTLAAPKYFPDQSFVRLCGISAYAVGNTPESRFNLALSVPGSDTYKIPSIRIGRVFSRSIPHEADIVGAQTVTNLDPAGTWTIAATNQQAPVWLSTKPANDKTTSIDQIRDIVLDLHIASIESI